MTPVYQTRLGPDGNCWSAVLATLFDVTIDETEQCSCNHPDWVDATNKFLRDRGFFSVEVRRMFVDGKVFFPISGVPNDALCAIVGQTASGVRHAQIVRTVVNGEDSLGFSLVHDPMPGGSTLWTVDDIIFFCKWL